MRRDDTIIVIVGDAHHMVSVAAEHLSEVSRTAPLACPITPGIVIEARPRLEFPDVDVRPLREKPRRDWEQRQAKRGKRA